MAVATGDKVELGIWTELGDQAAVNIMHLGAIGQTGPDAPEQDVVNALATRIQGKMATLITNAAFYRGCTLRLWSAGAWQAYYYKKFATNGTAGTDALPKQVAGIISWRTPLGGPRNRGRSYLPFPDEADGSSDATPTAGYVTNATALGNDLLSTGALVINVNTTMTFARYIYHRGLSSFTQCDRFQVPKKWATHRSRGSYGRPNKIPDPLT